MKVEEKLRALGLEVPSLEELYRTNASGAHYISHFPVQNLLYLSGTTPRKEGHAHLPRSCSSPRASSAPSWPG